MSQGLNKTDLPPEVKLVMRIVVSCLFYVVERVNSLAGARAFREILNTPIAEFERRWGFEKGER